MISEGTAPKMVQDESKQTYDAMLKKDLVQINFDQPAQAIHNFIRGCEHFPGAWTIINDQVRVLEIFTSDLASDYSMYPLIPLLARGIDVVRLQS